MVKATKMVLPLGCAALLASLFASSPAIGDPGEAAGPMPRTAAISFTDAQVKQGRGLYVRACAACHGAALEGGAGPALKGRTFLGKWSAGTSLGALYKYIRDKMPPGGAGSFSPAQLSSLVAVKAKGQEIRARRNAKRG